MHKNAEKFKKYPRPNPEPLREEFVQRSSRERSPPLREEAPPSLVSASQRVLFERSLQELLEGRYRGRVDHTLRELVVALHEPKKRSAHDLCAIEGSVRVQLLVVQGAPVS